MAFLFRIIPVIKFSQPNVSDRIKPTVENMLVQIGTAVAYVYLLLLEFYR